MTASFDPSVKQFYTVNGLSMACVEAGGGDPIVFLHGNPTSSYLWRNVIPHVLDLGRAIAPDLIGMGDSDKLPESGPDRYRFVEHRDYLNGLLDQVLKPDEKVILVIHDWGSALGFDWAFRNPGRVRGIAFMEGIVKPLSIRDFPYRIQPVFEGFRSDKGEDMVLRDNMFVEQVLTGAIMRPLTDAEMAVYRAPFKEPGESRRPTLTWPRQIPFDGSPEDVHAIVEAYSAWLAGPDSPPKLFVNAQPGAILRGETVDFVRTWPNLHEVTVPGTHFIQEDSPGAIGGAVADWIRYRLDA